MLFGIRYSVRYSWSFRFIPKVFVPALDKQYFTIDMWLPEGTRIEKTDRMVTDIAAYIGDEAGVETVSTYIGRTPPRYYLSNVSFGPQSNYAQLLVKCQTSKASRELHARLQDSLCGKFPEPLLKVNKFELSPLTEAMIEARFLGPDPAVLGSLASVTIDIMRRNPKVADARNECGNMSMMMQPVYAGGRVLESIRKALNSLVGLPLDTPSEIENRVAPVEYVATTLADKGGLRPEVRLAEERIELEKRTLRLNDAQYKPQFYIGANGGYYAPGYNFRPDLSPNYTLYAQLSVPLFEWGKRRSSKRASQQRIGMAEDALHKAETAVELETRTAWTAMTQAMQRIELAQSSLGKAQENERRATEKYEQGAISVADVLDAQVYRQTAQMNCVEAKAAAQVHYSELLKAVNGYNSK